MDFHIQPLHKCTAKREDDFTKYFLFSLQSIIKNPDVLR